MLDSSVKRVLLIRLSSLGDIARLLPCIAEMRTSQPGTRFDLTVEDRFSRLLTLFPVADRVIPYPRIGPGSPLRHPLRWLGAIGRYLLELRKQRYDLAIDLHGIFRSALVGKLSGSTLRAGYARGFGKEGSHHLYDLPIVPASERRISRFDRYAGTLRQLGFDIHYSSFLQPAIERQTKEFRSDFLREKGLTEGRYLFLFLGTSRAQAFKRWPVDRFLETADICWKRFKVPAIIGWGPEERELLNRIQEKSHLLIAPDLNLPSLLAFIHTAGAFVGADTGAMHLSALMGTPTVAVMGATDPVLNHPYGSRSRVVFEEGIEGACTGETCPHITCMARLSAESVIEALEQLGIESGERTNNDHRK